MYLQHPSVNGSVMASNFSGWILLDDFFCGLNRGIGPTIAGRGNDRDRGICTFSHVEITKPIDKTSSQFFSDCVQAKSIPQIKVAVVQTDGGLKPYLEYTLSNVLIASVSKHVRSDGHPFEVIKLKYSKIEERFTLYDNQHRAGSAVIVGYDAATASLV